MTKANAVIVKKQESFILARIWGCLVIFVICTMFIFWLCLDMLMKSPCLMFMFHRNELQAPSQLLCSSNIEAWLIVPDQLESKSCFSLLHSYVTLSK